jgi:flagellar biosynthesis protein FlhG
MIGQVERIAELTNLHPRSNNNEQGPMVIAFTSGKGGTGKSFVSLNTAFTLSRMRKKILLIDFDINFANQHILVDQFPEFTIADYFSGKKNFCDVISNYSENLHFIFGESGIKTVDITNTTINRMFNEISSLGGKYDYVIFDTASGGGEQVLSVLAKSDLQVIVANPEPTAVMDAYVIIKLMIAAGISGNEKFVIINRAENLEEGKTAFENINSAINNFLKQKVNLGGIVLNSPKIKNSISSQKIFTEENPIDNQATAITKIADKISNFIHLENINHKY